MENLDQSQLVLFFAIGLVSMIIIFTTVIILQQRRIKNLQQPRYGFLGKSIAPALMTFLMVGGLVGGVFLINQDQTQSPIAEAGGAEIKITSESCTAVARNEYRYLLDTEIDITESDEDLLDIGDLLIVRVVNNSGSVAESISETQREITEGAAGIYPINFGVAVNDLDSSNSVKIFAILEDQQTGRVKVLSTLDREVVCADIID